MKSNKKEDPLKIGRFGIGFNSVYHITGIDIFFAFIDVLTLCNEYKFSV